MLKHPNVAPKPFHMRMFRALEPHVNTPKGYPPALLEKRRLTANIERCSLSYGSTMTDKTNHELPDLQRENRGLGTALPFQGPIILSTARWRAGCRRAQVGLPLRGVWHGGYLDRKSTRLNSSH